MYCSVCGKEIDENNVFCPFCGTKIEKIEEKTEEETEGNVEEKVSIKTRMSLKIMAFGILTLIVGLFISAYISYVNKPIHKIEQAFENKDLDAVKELIDEVQEYNDWKMAKKYAQKYVDEIIDDYINEFQNSDFMSTYDNVIYISENILIDDEEIQEKLDLLWEIDESRNSYKVAENYKETGELELAICEMEKVSGNDTKYYEIAQEELAEMKIDYQNEIIESVGELVDNEYYDEAIWRIKWGLNILEDNTELETKLDEIKTQKQQSDLADAIENINKNIEKESYEDALREVNIVIANNPDNLQFSEMKNSIISAYKEKQMQKVQYECEEGNYEGALIILKNTQELLVDDYEIEGLIEKYQSYLPVSLTSLIPYEKSYAFGIGNTTSDTYGNSYSNSITLESGLRGVDKYNAKLTYLINGEYNRIGGTVAYSADVYEDYVYGSAHLEVYSDDILVYTSPVINDDTQPVKFEVDIGNSCHKLVIKLMGDSIWDAYIVLGNAQLYNR